MNFINNFSNLLNRPAVDAKNHIDSSDVSTRSETNSPVGSAASSLSSSLSSRADLPKAVRFSNDGPQVKTFERHSPMIKGQLWYGQNHSTMMHLDSALEGMLNSLKDVESRYLPNTPWVLRMRIGSLKNQILDCRQNIDRLADRPTTERTMGQLHQSVLGIHQQMRQTFDMFGI